MRVLMAIIAALVAASLAGDAGAQTWPTRQPIKLIVPFPPGNALDTLARPIFDQVAKQVGQAFVFDNRAGAGGTIGMGLAAKAAPDGYTFLVNSSIHTIVPTSYTKLSFDTLRELTPVIPLGQFPNVMVTPPGRFKSIQDLVAKAKANPGSITYGSGGIGAATHLNAERFRIAAGFEGVHVPFRGAPDAVREVLGGRIDFYFSPLVAVTGLIAAKELDALVVSSLKRDPSLPEVPTTIEAGYPNSEYIFWVGVFAPSATPKDIVQRLHDEIAKAMNDPALKQAIAKLGAEPMSLTPSAFDAYIRTELESNAKLIKAAGIEQN